MKTRASWALVLVLALGLLLVDIPAAQAANTASVSGQVTYAGGAPAVGGLVTFYLKNDSGNFVESRTADVTADGTYLETFMPTGQYIVYFSPGPSTDYAGEWWGNTYERTDATVITLGENGSASNINAVLNLGASLTVTAVEGPSQTPAAGVGVWLYSPANTATYLGMTGADGVLTTRGVMPNTYRVSFGKSGYHSECWNDFEACSRFDLITISSGGALQTLPVWMETTPASFTFFSDVPPTSTFYTAVEWMASQGISTGTPVIYERPLYKPVDVVSRQAMALFLFRMQHIVFVPTAPQAFADVPPSSPYYYAVQWMYEDGITTGTPQPSGLPLFKPLDSVSRQTMATFLIRMAHTVYVPGASPHFADVPASSSNYAAIEWMWQTGISTGTAQPSGLPLYKPLDPVSRQAMALFLYRYASLP